MIYIEGDAVELFTQHAREALLIHQVNCQGVMNSGIAKQIRNEFPTHFEDYLATYHSYSRPLGRCVETELQDDKHICGIFGQERYGYNGKRYTNYAALTKGLMLIAKSFQDYYTFYLPKNIGCDRGGADWNIVETLLKDLEDMYKIEFTVVQFNK